MPDLRTSPALLFAIAALNGAAPTQGTPKDAAAREAAVDQQAAQILTGFARGAETYKAFTSARKAWEMIVDHHDPQNRGALTALGYRQVKGEWQPPAAGRKDPVDAATPAQRRSVDETWKATLKKVARLHRDLGLALLSEGNEMRGRFHLEHTLELDPEDVQVHKALGHEEIDGFFGSTDDLAFVRRMRALLDKAKDVRDLEVEVRDAPDSAMPEELRATGLPFVGIRSTHFTYWVHGSPDEARVPAIHAERAIVFLQHLLGDGARSHLNLSPRKWVGIVRSDVERDLLIAASPSVLNGETAAQVRLFAAHSFRTGGATAEVAWHTADLDADRATAFVAKRCFGGGKNTALAEGMVHLTTWLLCGTTLTRYASLPSTVSGDFELPRSDPKAWLERLQMEIDAGRDWPLVQVPRERSDSFRDSTRLKVWTFVPWLICRHPVEWTTLMSELAKQNLSPEDVEAAFKKVLDRRVVDVEEEWRRWVRKGSRIGKASGFGV